VVEVGAHRRHKKQQQHIHSDPQRHRN